MITRFFGLPGVGKTTVAAKLAYDALRSGLYAHVYGNVAINLPGYTYIPFTYVGQYQLEDCCLIIDEAAIECGNRDFKNFSKDRVEFFMTHRHYDAKVFLFSQEPDGIDIKIRNLTEAMFYLKKGLFLGHWFTTCYRIPYKLVWPTENSNGENLGKIVMGYVKPPLLASLFAERIYRPKFYPYFDSWEAKKLPPLPPDVITIPGCIAKKPGIGAYYRYTGFLIKAAKYAVRRERKAYKKARKIAKKRLDSAALVQAHAPTGINALYQGVRIH